MFESKLHPEKMEIKFIIVFRNFPDFCLYQNLSGLCYFTTDYTESMGNARIVSNNNLRGFISDIRETSGESIRGNQVKYFFA